MSAGTLEVILRTPITRSPSIYYMDIIFITSNNKDSYCNITDFAFVSFIMHRQPYLSHSGQQYLCLYVSVFSCHLDLVYT